MYFQFHKLTAENSNTVDVLEVARFSMGQYLESGNHLTDLQVFSYSRKADKEINHSHSVSGFFPN